MDDLNEALYDALNSEPDWSNPSFTDRSMYGKNGKVRKGFWKSSFSEFGIDEEYKMEDDSMSNNFEMYYEFWSPKKPNKDLPFLILTHGVPVNGREWNDTVQILSLFVNVMVVDLLGMGNSSKPLAFNHWTWGLHARIFWVMINNILEDREFVIGANDWGAGMVQKFAELYSNPQEQKVLRLRGIILGSPIALNGYWVQHIGSLKALKDIPYPSPTFSAEAVRFAGVLTSLLETMFHRTAQIHNQYSMAPLQEPYVEISYGDVTKNPDNTIYKEHAIRVLAEQASVILGNGELLPHHPSKNPNGLKFTRWNVPVLVLWGKNDKYALVGFLIFVG